MGKYKVTAEDFAKREPDRRLKVLKEVQSRETASPKELAEAWDLHPTSTFRALERLRKSLCVERVGRGITARYSITNRGIDRLKKLKKMFA
jgi:DNA-binding IclR family transcriptional regulator